MNPNWFKMPILYNGIYPENIKKLAEKIDVPADEIAKNKNIDGDVIGYHYLRREIIQRIVGFTQIPEYPNETVIDFMDGSSTVVYMKHDRLVKMIDEFLSLEPTIKLIPLKSFKIVSEEEYQEMGEDPYIEEDE